MEVAGGPIFESHFRGMLGLLLGQKRPPDSLTPSLMVFRALYTNAKLREHLVKKAQGQDVVIDDFIEEALRAKGDMHISSIAPYITSKFTRFVSDTALRNITCQPRVLDLDDIVNSGKILLFHLGKGRFGELAAGLLASQVIARIRYAVMKRGVNGVRQPFYLYADEFQMFADQRFAEMLAESRKFGLSLTLAHQYVDQIPVEVRKAVLGNVGTMMTLRVGPSDAEALEALFWPYFTKRDLSGTANFQAFVRSYGSLGHKPFSVELLPPLGAGDRESAERIRELSRLKYGKDHELVEREIRAIYETYREYSD